MREQLIGYLLSALEPDEHQIVEAQLSRDPQLKRELDLLSRSLQPLACDREHYHAPLGLAHRTCEFVAEQAQILPAPSTPAYAPSSWRLSDMVVAAGIFIAATMLFFPALNQSRFAARLLGCQNNLRELGMGLTNYADLHQGYFPDIPAQGECAAAGIYATKLIEGGFLANPRVIICPASAAADEETDVLVPTSQELLNAQGPRLIVLQKKMGGSYGYNIGYVSGGKYQATRNLHRPRFAIMADAPNAEAPFRSLNHGDCGQNVLFEDLHVQYLTTCKARGCKDNIYVNDDGHVALGKHLNDAVVGPSHARPVIVPTAEEVLDSNQ